MNKQHKFRSKFEKRFANYLEDNGITYEYENLKIPYQRKVSTYTPDFELPNGIIIEVKGLFKPEDRSKHLLIKEQHPELDIRFLFQNSNNKLNKKSSTSYADWCDKHGFKWAHKFIPDSWLSENEV